MGINTSARSRRLGIAVTVFLLAAFSTLLAAVAIAAMPVESYHSQGTFRYKIYDAPDWRNGTDKKVIALYYGSSYEIAEESLAEVNAKLLRVTGSQNHLSIYYSYGNRAGQSGTIFDAVFNSPEFPFPYPFGHLCEIDVTGIISQANIINGSISITLTANLNSISASVSDSDLKRAYIASEFGPRRITNIAITVLNGKPVEVKSGNVTVTQTAHLPVDEWEAEDSMELYNPSVVKAKEAVPAILTMTVILMVVAGVLSALRGSKSPD